MSQSQSIMTPLEIETRSIFTQSNYFVSEKHVKTAAFDFIAVNTEMLNEFYLCKTLSTLDNFNKDHSIELRIISELMSGLPLLISNCTSTETETKDNTVYFRYGIPGINISTLSHFLNYNILPRFMARRGGLYVRIDSDKFQSHFDDSGKSVTDVSKQANISRKTIYSYFKESKFVSKEYIHKLAELFDIELQQFTHTIKFQNKVEHITTSEQAKKVTEPKNKLQRQVDDFLKSLERNPINTFWFTSVPFDGVSTLEKHKTKSPTINPINFVTGTTLESFSKRDRKRMKTTAAIIRSLHNKNAVWVLGTPDEDFIDGAPVSVITIDELEKVTDLDELLCLLAGKRKEMLKKQLKDRN